MNFSLMNFSLSNAGELFLRASWQAGVLALLIFAAQSLAASRISARWRYNLWMLVVLRLLLPVVPATQWSVHNWIAIPSKSQQPLPTQSKPLHAELSVVVLEAHTIPIQSQPPISIPPKPPKTWRDVAIPAAWTLWLAGFSFFFIRTLRATLKLSRQSHHFIPITDPHIVQLLDTARQRLRISQRISLLAAPNLNTPALMGLLHPRILLPTKVINEFRPSELRLIFLHELAHFRRHDIAINWLITLLGMLHWFNPLLALAFSRIRAERELACDELVLKTSAPDERREYGNTMIKLLQTFSGGSALVGAVGILEGQAPLRRRITMIAQFERKQSRPWIALLTTIILAMVALTDAAVGQQNPGPRRPQASGGYPGVAGPGGVAGVAGQANPYGAPGAQAPAMAEGPAPRFADVAQDKNAEAVNEKTRATLRKPLPEVKFDSVALGDAIAFLRDVTQLNIYVDWKMTEASGIARDVPISIHLRNVPAGEVLRLALREASPEMRYQVESGIVVISPSAPQPVAVIKAYNVDDLCYSDASFATRRKVLEDEMKSAADETARNQINQQVRDFQMMIDQTKGVRMQQIVELIQTTVAPYAGTGMAVRAFDTKLIVTSDEGGHQEVAKVLNMLREKGEGAGGGPNPVKGGGATAP
jgi:beta-lactamase regulating signal transducer with metallopeptidase domain